MTKYEGMFRSRRDAEWCGSVGVFDTEAEALDAAQRQGQDCTVWANEIEESILDDAIEIGLRLQFDRFLRDPGTPRLSFEEWKERQANQALRAFAEEAAIASKNAEYADAHGIGKDGAA
jgi:hypothetical protein